MRRICLGLIALLLACSDSSEPSGLGPLNPFPEVATVTIMPPPTTALTVGSNMRLTVAPRDALGYWLRYRTVAFTSSDENVARVDLAGLVSALSEGSATITATCEGESDQITISVVPAPPDYDDPWGY